MSKEPEQPQPIAHRTIGSRKFPIFRDRYRTINQGLCGRSDHVRQAIPTEAKEDVDVARVILAGRLQAAWYEAHGSVPPQIQLNQERREEATSMKQLTDLALYPEPLYDVIPASA